MLRVRSVELTETPYEILVGFNNQEYRLINLKSHLWGDIFTPLLEISLFNQVSVDLESETITWPNGADFAPVFLYEQGIPTHQEKVS